MDEGKRPADATASRFATASRPRAVGRARRSRGRRGASPVPWWLPAVACAGVLYLVLPLVFMGMRVPWSDLPGIVSNESTVAAMELSLRTCLAAVVVDGPGSGALGDTEGGTGVETTAPPEPVLVS